MAPLPKRRHSSRRSGKREQGKLKVATSKPNICSSCQSPKLPHRRCPKCGFYK